MCSQAHVLGRSSHYTDDLANDEKPRSFRIGRKDSYWARTGRTRADLVV